MQQVRDGAVDEGKDDVNREAMRGMSMGAGGREENKR